MNLVERVKAILLTPKTEWPVIEREAGDVASLFTGYVAILAAIPVIAGFIGTSIIGISTPIGTIRVGILPGLVSAIIGYVLAFVGVYVLALVIDALAPTFGGSKNSANALKLAVYSWTPAWLAGIFTLIPALAFLGILGLYSLYLLYVGLPLLMRNPAEKTLTYTLAVIVVAIVIILVIGWIPFALMGMPR